MLWRAPSLLGLTWLLELVLLRRRLCWRLRGVPNQVSKRVGLSRLWWLLRRVPKRVGLNRLLAVLLLPSKRGGRLEWSRLLLLLLLW